MEGRGAIVESTLLKQYARSEVQAIVEEFKVPFAVPSGVTLYKIVYETVDPFGESTQASGTIAIPDTNVSMPLVSYQHGTITSRSAVSSVLGLNLEAAVLSGTGYITVQADYLGLGESEILHPYLHAASLASAVVDMLKAAQAFLKQQKKQTNGQIFLLGYSQGGYATMAAQREIERTNAFALTASLPMAGPYHISETMPPIMFSDNEYASPAYLPYTLYSYNEVYKVYGNIGEVFAPPYNQLIPQLFDGTQTLSQINTQLPSVPKNILQQSFVSDFTAFPNYPFKAVLEENDLINWTPTSKTILIHCESDEQVPVANSRDTYNAFIAREATDVELITFEGGTHAECGVSAMLYAKVEILDKLRTQ
jgi:pimeloyl-ACP methyl ester carboxylesterase